MLLVGWGCKLNVVEAQTEKAASKRGGVCSHMSVRIWYQVAMTNQTKKPTIVIFFNDWEISPHGSNAGGGEIATFAVARAFAALGYQVIAAGNIPEGDTEKDGIQYINFGADYGLARVAGRLEGLDSYYLFAATLAHPFVVFGHDKRCRVKILINHSPSACFNGMRAETMMELVDYVVFVSQAQSERARIMPGIDDGKIRVVRNAFQDDTYSYAGPERRNWKRLVYAGRIEPAKGIHVLLEAYKKLTEKVSDLELRVFGDESFWPQIADQRGFLEKTISGLKFYGRVPQNRIAAEFQEAGVLVFPSISFESAGLSIIDSQASGCPAVAFPVGGVPEYLLDGQCGRLVQEISSEALYEALLELLENPAELERMSNNGATIGRQYTWRNAAEKLLELAREVDRLSEEDSHNDLHPVLKRSLNPSRVGYDSLLTDLEKIAQGRVLSDPAIEKLLESMPECAGPYLWKGLRREHSGDSKSARELYELALERSDPRDWQPLIRLILLSIEQGDLSQTSVLYLEDFLARFPAFPLNSQLSEVLSIAKGGSDSLSH